MAANKKTGGLAGVTAGQTSLCTVGKEGAGLTYRGYDIYDLSDNASFEEVAFLLLYGHLPNRGELDGYIAKLRTLRGLPDAVKQVLEMIPANAHPMDVLRSGVSILGNVEAEGDFSNQSQVADRLLACIPSMLLYWHRFHVDGKRIDVETDDDTVSGHFLHMLHDEPPREMHRQSLDTTLILYAEHEFNASTFTARVITGTLVGLSFGGQRCDWRVTRRVAWRCKRSGDGTDSEIFITGRGDGRRAWHARAQRKNNGLRASRIYDLRSTKFREQKNGEEHCPKKRAMTLYVCCC